MIAGVQKWTTSVSDNLPASIFYDDELWESLGFEDADSKDH
jgi:hypothetical protein